MPEPLSADKRRATSAAQTEYIVLVDPAQTTGEVLNAVTHASLARSVEMRYPFELDLVPRTNENLRAAGLPSDLLPAH